MPWSAHQGIPPAGVYAGNDQDGSPIYIGRAFHEGDQLPAKVIPSKQAAYVSHNGVEIYKSHFEVSLAGDNKPRKVPDFCLSLRYQ